MGRARIVGLLAAAVMMVGIAAWAVGVLTTSAPPPGLAKPDRIEHAPVVEAEFDDERPVQLTIAQAPPTQVRTGVSGIVTESSCVVGDVVKSGRHTFSVDGSPLVNLSTTVPFWRDLRDGDSGVDVDALQTELRRLGQDVRIDGEVGPETLNAVAAIRGLDEVDQFEMSAFVWLPAPALEVRQCEALRGAQVGSGGSLMSVDGSVPTVNVMGLPIEALPGERTLLVDGDEFQLAAMTITDESEIRRLVESPAFRDARKIDEQTWLEATVVLSAPARVLSVPPSAVVTAISGQACVFDDNGSISATVVGSQLGQTFIVVDGKEPQSVLISPKAHHACN